ncbi:MAG: hypothetical protein K2X47_03240 [Bdellovibrionales bacterium]|nr:hypothetical protein [Bdellovibrionales bacterium]
MRLFIPSKTFLIGEYSVLEKGSAVVVATAPRFEFSAHERGIKSGFHPESPAGKAIARLSEEVKHKNFCGDLIDPHRGRGGFGGSTAEWLSAQLTMSDERDPWALWSLYQEDAALNGKSPSGADVLAQILGGVVMVDFSENSYQKLNWSFDDGGFLVFRTGYKLSTHTHLREMKALPKNELKKHTEAFTSAFKGKDFLSCAQSVNAFGAELLRLGFVDARAQSLIERLRPYVSAVKGCGAMGVDTVVCFVTSEQKSGAKKTAAGQGLEFVADETMLVDGAVL